MYTIIQEYPHQLGNPRVVIPYLFVWLWDGAPKICENIVRLCPRLTSGRTKTKVYPVPKVILVFPRGGAGKTPHVYVVAGDVSWILDGHVLKDMTIGPQTIVRLRPHLSLLFHHHPRSLISIPRSPSREEVWGCVLNTHSHHRHCNILVQSPPARYCHW